MTNVSCSDLGIRRIGLAKRSGQIPWLLLGSVYSWAAPGLLIACFLVSSLLVCLNCSWAAPGQAAHRLLVFLGCS